MRTRFHITSGQKTVGAGFAYMGPEFIQINQMDLLSLFIF